MLSMNMMNELELQTQTVQTFVQKHEAEGQLDCLSLGEIWDVPFT